MPWTRCSLESSHKYYFVTAYLRGKRRKRCIFSNQESCYRSPNCLARDVRLSRRVSSEMGPTDRTVVVRIVAGIHAVRYHAARPASAIKNTEIIAECLSILSWRPQPNFDNSIGDLLVKQHLLFH